MVCAGCHLDEEGRAAGKLLADVPPFLGKFYPANLTSDPGAGIGAWSDGELARLLRTGVRRNGRLAAVMPRFTRMSDDDVAALIGFVRSGDPMFAPVPVKQPPVEGTAIGKLILTFVVGADPATPPAGAVVAPPAGPTADYGRYLVREIIQCGDCHTAGFAGDKSDRPGAYAGGFELQDAKGASILSSNLTPDAETGLGKWSEAEFVRALRDGVRPDGTVLRPPMVPFRTLDETEARAVFAYLRTLPPVHNAIPRPPAAPAPAGGGADALFVSLGCVACHGEGAAFREKLRPAAGQPLEEIARRILHPEAFNPRSLMPTFAGRIDEAQAHALAGYVRAEAARLPPAPAAGTR